MSNYAVLIDGGFIKKRLGRQLKRFPLPADIDSEVARIKSNPRLKNLDLLRVYYYDAPPATGLIKNPLDGSVLNLANHKSHAQNVSLQQALEMLPDFALRSGETMVHGWTLGSAALKDLKKAARNLAPNDLVPKVEQKGVDLRIGLDIARLSIRQLVNVIVVVTGDSDMVPAFKFARREGVRVYLDHMGHGVKRELKAHVDAIL